MGLCRAKGRSILFVPSIRENTMRSLLPGRPLASSKCVQPLFRCDTRHSASTRGSKVAVPGGIKVRGLFVFADLCWVGFCLVVALFTTWTRSRDSSLPCHGERESKSERGREGEEHEATVLRAQLVRSSQTTPAQQDKTLVDERTHQLETSMQVLLTAMTMAWRQ